jgi:hypothetical protein
MSRTGFAPKFSSIVGLTHLPPMSASKTLNTVCLFPHLNHHHHHQVLIATSMTVRAVINETLRLFPPVPLNVRESRASPCLLPPSDPSYPDSGNDHLPLYMPGSTTIIYLPLIVQRNKALWGPDADEFDPERWLQPERIAKFVANPSMFAPFSAGPRIVRTFPHLLRSRNTIVITVHRPKLCLQRNLVFPCQIAPAI